MIGACNAATIDSIRKTDEPMLRRDIHHARAASIRTVANQPVAQEFYETVLRPAWPRLADRFATTMKAFELSLNP